MPTQYTIQVDMEDVDGNWIIVHRSPDVTDDRDPSSLAHWVADTHVVADGADWRVRVWLGHDAGADTEPVCSLLVNEYEP
ncbi:hypothetical protein ACGF7U_30330 [Micromonospora sp. NPDC047670]|uniref:hypothetical protein n=1 Tax=Micromonospora sp. NPDC047670 TaxID=3364252 RepID=UPI00371CF9CE